MKDRYISFRIEEATAIWLGRLAEIRNTSRSEIIRKAIERTKEDREEEESLQHLPHYGYVDES